MLFRSFHVHKGAEGYARVAPRLCEGLKGGLLIECSRSVGGGAMFANGHNPVPAGALCKRLPAEQRADCERGVDREWQLICKGLDASLEP